jgi:hypothetical protein
MSLLERYERDAVLLERNPLADILDLADVEAKRWVAIDAQLRHGGEPSNARNFWVQLLNEDSRGLGQNAAAVANTTTSSAVFPALTLPANFWSYKRLMHIRARGRWAMAAVATTMTFRVQQTAPAAVTVVSSAALSVGSGALSNQAWELDVQVAGRGEGTAGAVYAEGDINMGAVTGTQYLPANGTAPANATVDTSVAETWQVELAWSVANAGHTFTGTLLEIKSIS